MERLGPICLNAPKNCRWHGDVERIGGARTFVDWMKQATRSTLNIRIPEADAI
jgi:hypothetical protein